MTKPPYVVPSMAEIRALRPNGLRIVSTFSGCGGSCLGFRMAGYRVAWANEFIESARDTYRANADPTTVLDARDIRQVQPAEIRAIVGDAEIDVLEGSPPCASFSTAGNREQDWGRVKSYSDGAQRTDDLFDEYVRLVAGLRPRAFVAENVSGLIKGVAKGVFRRVLDALSIDDAYVVGAKLLDAQWLGVPQGRQRVIFVGVRRDVASRAPFPEPLPYRYTLSDALRTLDAPVDREASFLAYAIYPHWLRLKPGQTSEKYFSLVRPSLAKPCPTVTATAGNPGAASVTHPLEPRKFSTAELRRICSFPDDFVLAGTYEQKVERLGRSVPPIMMRAVAEALRPVLGGE